MITKFWQVIKDDSKRTFEVCGQERNTNPFTNEVYAMQRIGLNVSSVIMPVTNKTSSRDLVKITGYAKENGLYARMQKLFRERSMPTHDEWEE